MNSQLAMTIFANINQYSFLHSSQISYRAVIEAIRIGLPNIGVFMDARIRQSLYLPKSI